MLELTPTHQNNNILSNVHIQFKVQKKNVYMYARVDNNLI